mgnify:CR=1 FL=1
MKTTLNSAPIAMQKAFIALILGAFLHSNLQANDDASNPCGALLCLLGGQTSGECKKYYEYYTIGITKEVSKECKYRADCISYTLPLKQLAHLKNCKLEGAPANAQVDTNLANSYGVTNFTQNLDGKINEMKGLEGECTQSELNRVEKAIIGKKTDCNQIDPDTGQNTCAEVAVYGFRINPNMTKACSLLATGQYSSKKVTYTCPTKEFYETQAWNKGFKEIKISKKEYDKIPQVQDKFIKEVEIQSLNASKIYSSLPNDEKGFAGKENGLYVFKRKEFYKKEPVYKSCWEVENKFKF